MKKVKPTGSCIPINGFFPMDMQTWNPSRIMPNSIAESLGGWLARSRWVGMVP
eukprot:CAMPEP_0117488098 /NCGR_PEP_ID=MMETSP0784-20121206/16337_1 /TAXON_ID=39447 /ORGANISM="" /LENGTH=52 /DNA_ID=CAMNT_0005282769 /DNA_START=222 /DNA_END=380 /DNA_ORIENTATION=+